MTEINITEDEYLQESKENIIKTSEVSITPVKAGLLLLLVIITIFNFTSVLTFVPTESMADEIQPNDILYASKLPYLTGEPERFDIIIFKYAAMINKIAPRKNYEYDFNDEYTRQKERDSWVADLRTRW